MTLKIQYISSSNNPAKVNFATVGRKTAVTISFTNKLSTNNVPSEHVEYLEGVAADYLGKYIAGNEIPIIQKIDRSIYHITFKSC
jgi:hypothetical protein